MPTRNDALNSRLVQESEIEITVKDGGSGRARTFPIWFVFDGQKLSLLPVHGSDTKWYKNVLANPSIRIEAGGAEGEFKVAAVTEHAPLSSIIEKFRAKYGDSGIKLYSKLDVALIAEPE